MLSMSNDRCCRPDYERVFDEAGARRELAKYRQEGPHGTARRLIDAVRAEGEVAGSRLLDIGGGVGSIGHELMAAGAGALTAVDLSRHYLEAAEDEARERGYLDRARFEFGDFVELAAAGKVEDADIVTLDRVLCCYRHWRALVAASTARTRRLYALVYPVDRPWVRIGLALENLMHRVRRSDFRAYVHPDRAVDRAIREAGFRRTYHHSGFVWRTVVYRRTTSP